jgi:PhnB protein
LHIYTEDVDRLFNQAIAAGVTVVMAVTDTFWGDRYGQLTDPFGYIWSIGTHKRDLSHEEIEKAGEAVLKEMKESKKQ